MSVSTILSLVLVLLKVANNFMSYVNEAKAEDAGRDKEIAKVSAAILQNTQAGKQILADVAKLTDDQVDSALKGLES